MRQGLGFLAISLLLANSAQAANANPSVRKDILDVPAVQSERAASYVLTAVAAAGKRLVAVGERSVILLSDDHGRNWRQAKLVPTSVTLTNVNFVSDKTGWAVGHGGAVLKTIDGGETWTRQFDGKQAAQIELAAADAAANKGAAETRRQSDAHHLVKEGADKPFLDVHFFDEQHGMVVGAYGLIFATHDGGNTWQSLIGEVDNQKGRHLYHITALGQDVLLTGEQGIVYRGPQTGQHFTTMVSPYVGTLFGAIATPDMILLYGLRGNAFRSTDQGANWTKVEFGQPVTIAAGTHLQDGRLAVVDETGRVFLSNDGGATFSNLAIPKMNAATGVVEAADGSLIISTQRGAVRVAAEALRLEKK
jgi:photosystem II stability/assembly factor-like uncharacterized protein